MPETFFPPPIFQRRPFRQILEPERKPDWSGGNVFATDFEKKRGSRRWPLGILDHPFFRLFAKLIRVEQFCNEDLFF
jgi:hypothetical protein